MALERLKGFRPFAHVQGVSQGIGFFVTNTWFLRRLIQCSKPIGNVKPLEAVAVKEFQTLGANQPICMVQNEAPTQHLKSQILPPFGDTMSEVIAAWHMTGIVSGKKYKPAPFEHPNITARKVFPNLAQRKGVKDKILP